MLVNSKMKCEAIIFVLFSFIRFSGWRFLLFVRKRVEPAGFKSVNSFLRALLVFKCTIHGRFRKRHYLSSNSNPSNARNFKPELSTGSCQSQSLGGCLRAIHARLAGYMFYCPIMISTRIAIMKYSIQIEFQNLVFLLLCNLSTKAVFVKWCHGPRKKVKPFFNDMKLRGSIVYRSDHTIIDIKQNNSRQKPLDFQFLNNFQPDRCQHFHNSTKEVIFLKERNLEKQETKISHTSVAPQSYALFPFFGSASQLITIGTNSK